MLSVNSYFKKKMKETTDALNASGQYITEAKLISFIVDGLGAESDSVIVHVYFKLDISDKCINLAKLKFILQKFEQLLNRNNLLTLMIQVHGKTKMRGMLRS